MLRTVGRLLVAAVLAVIIVSPTIALAQGVAATETAGVQIDSLLPMLMLAPIGVGALMASKIVTGPYDPARVPFTDQELEAAAHAARVIKAVSDGIQNEDLQALPSLTAFATYLGQGGDEVAAADRLIDVGMALKRGTIRIEPDDAQLEAPPDEAIGA